MIVCVCRRVSDHTLARLAREGMSFDEVQLELGVATQCGQCEGCARSICAQAETAAVVQPSQGVFDAQPLALA